MSNLKSQEENSDYVNNADESGDDTPFPNEGDDEEEENVEPDLTREHAPPPVRPRVYESHMPFHSREIPYLDHLLSMPDADALTRDLDKIRTIMWDESRATVLSKGMLFADKAPLSRTVRMYNIKEYRDIVVHESSPDVYKVICRRWSTGYNWMLRARKLKTNMWGVGKYIGTHNCEMDTFSGNHSDLNVDLISFVLIPHIEASKRYKIKEYITSVHQAFKPAIDNFVHCRPAISIDDTHVYGKYDIKLLIAIAVDANGSIFFLEFAICANESQETWTLFLNHLKEHVVRQSSCICLISDRHGGILSSVQNLRAWQKPYAYHHYCVKHMKANFQRAYPNKDLHDLILMAAIDHQECKFRRRMELIRQKDQGAYTWLMRHELDKCTLYADGGRRWGILTINVLESFNGLLKSARGLPVTAMVRIPFK
ncbi:uncharacterized protein [Nicotiana tomentosiformis]|uniref:uncharacterized protein n=1 Tax=Nicotiana tomentosiformis TaxID=4098 RepID=UPI00388C3BD8